MSDQEAIIYYTIRGKRVLPAIWKPTREGTMFTVGYQFDRDVHLQLIAKDGRIAWHIRDSQETRKPEGKQFYPERLPEIITKYKNRWLLNYHGNLKAWQMTEKLQQKVIMSFGPKVVEGVVEIPLELSRLQIILDINNPERWKRVRVRKLKGNPFPWAIIGRRGMPVWIIVLDDHQLLAFTDKQYQNLLDELGKLFGYQDYADHYQKVIGEKRIQREIEKRLGD